MEKKTALHDKRIAIAIALIIHVGMLFIPVHLSDTITIKANQIVQLKLTPSISSISQQKEPPKPTQLLPAETATPVTPTNTAVLTQSEPEPADVPEKSVTPGDQSLATSEAQIEQSLSVPSSPPLAMTEKPVIAPRLDSIAGLEPFKSVVGKHSLAESAVLTPLPSHDAVTQEIPDTIDNAKVPELAVESPLLNPGRTVTETSPEPAQIIQEETATPGKPTTTAALPQAKPGDTNATEKRFTLNDQGLAKSAVQVEQPLPVHTASPMAIAKKLDIPTQLRPTAELKAFQTIAKPFLAKNKAERPLQSVDAMQKEVLQNENGIAASTNISIPEHRTFPSAQVSLTPNFNDSFASLIPHETTTISENGRAYFKTVNKTPLSHQEQKTGVPSLSGPPEDTTQLPSIATLTPQEPVCDADGEYNPSTQEVQPSAITTIAANTDTTVISESDAKREESAEDGMATGATLASNESASTGGNTDPRQSNILPFRKKPLFINGTGNGEEEGTEEGTGIDENKSITGSIPGPIFTGSAFADSWDTGSAWGGFPSESAADGSASGGSLSTSPTFTNSTPTSLDSIKSTALPESTAAIASLPTSTAQKVLAPIGEPVIESTESTISASPTNKEVKTQETDSLHESATAQINILPAVPASPDAVASDAVASLKVSVTSVDEVLTRMSAQIAERKTYPEAAKLRSAEGTVKVGVSIYKDGTLKSSKIVTRSGSAVLDRAASDLVKGLFPMPFNLTKEMEVVVTIEYRLTH